MLRLDEWAPPAPRLPNPRAGAIVQVAVSAAVHVTLALIAALVATIATPAIESIRAPAADQPVVRLVFTPPEVSQAGGGGGGGGNRQPAPILRAQGIGSDATTLRTRRIPAVSTPTPTPALVEHELSLPSVVLDARPLASGLFEQAGLPDGVTFSGTSTGPGAGGGVGSGIGTGMGSGRGPGLGPGSGGGTGGGAYRPGGGVSMPHVLKEVRPRYTPDALRNMLQGTVILEVVVTRDGCASQVRVIKSLDPGGLDEEAIAAVQRWQFEPGRRGGVPVDVIVTIMLDFAIR